MLSSITEPSSEHILKSGLFHLNTLPSVQVVMQMLNGTCLSSSWPLLEEDRNELLKSNSILFSSGSAPRDVWAESGLGGTINASVVATGAPLQLIDLCSMTANTILGINDPWVKLKQIAYLLSSKPHYLTTRIGCDLYYRIARRILHFFNKFGNVGDFVINLRQCNGSDAVELALHAAWKAATKFPKRRKLATFRGSYHGENLTANLVSEHQPGGLLIERVDNVEFFSSPQINQLGELTKDALATLSKLERDADLYFAVIIEPIQWRNSVHVIPYEFLRRLRDICTRKSICLIFDETQNAFGYTGTICFAENCGVCPDISAFSKALTSGHGPLAIMVAKKSYQEIEGPFGAKINSGNMLPLVAVDAVLDRLLGMDFEEIKAIPKWLPSGFAAELRTGLLTTAYTHTVTMIDELFAKLKERFPSLIGASKGIGLVRGLVILGKDGKPSEQIACRIAKVCLIHGVYVRQAGTTILIKPCIVLSKAEVELALVSLSRTFEDVLHTRDV